MFFGKNIFLKKFYYLNNAKLLVKVSHSAKTNLTTQFKDISGQLPNNSKQLARDLIAAAARVLRPDTTSELIRDILHCNYNLARFITLETV
jgi:hypothetical protein